MIDSANCIRGFIVDEISIIPGVIKKQRKFG